MWLEIFIFVLLVFIADYIGFLRNVHQLKHVPIVSKIPVVGCIFALSSFRPDNLHLKFKEFVARYGKTFYARFLGVPILVTADARYIEHVLNSQKHISKHVMYLMLKPWLGNGLLLSTGSKWLAMRKIITPTFHFKILEQFVEIFDQQSNILVDKLKQSADGKTVIDIYPPMGLLTLDIIAETAMGVHIDAQVNENSDFANAVKDVTTIIATRFMRPHLGFVSLFRLLEPEKSKKQKQCVDLMHTYTKKIIEERRMLLTENTENKSSQIIGEEQEMGIKKRMALLDVLLQSTMGGEPLPDQQICDEVNTFMFEGHDTTTSSASLCLYLLSRNPEIQRKLFEEIRAHFGDDLNRPIKYQDLQQLDYLGCVIKETLRLFPPVPAIGRVIKEEYQLLDLTIPAKSNIIILLWQLLRDPEVFTDPERFWPERHLLDNPSANAFSNIPFSAGPRNCIGQRFALYELKTIVIKILRNFELLEMGEKVQPLITIVLRSKSGVNLGLKPRVY